MKVSDIATSLCCGLRWIGATGGLGLLTGGNPGRGGRPGPPREGGPLLPLSFLNLLFILNRNSFILCLKIYPIAARTAMIKIIRIHIHHDEPSSVVLVRQQTCGVSHEYVVTGSWNSEHSSMHV